MKRRLRTGLTGWSSNNASMRTRGQIPRTQAKLTWQHSVIPGEVTRVPGGSQATWPECTEVNRETWSQTRRKVRSHLRPHTRAPLIINLINLFQYKIYKHRKSQSISYTHILQGQKPIYIEKIPKTFNSYLCNPKMFTCSKSIHMTWSEMKSYWTLRLNRKCKLESQWPLHTNQKWLRLGNSDYSYSLHLGNYLTLSTKANYAYLRMQICS